jgi:DNA-binding CsgD family transcriptional regulator
LADPDSDRRIRQTLQLGEFAQMRLPVLPVRPPMRLTPGERHVIALIVQGRSDSQIAKARGTSVRTVLNQLSSVFRKLGLKSRDELVQLLGQVR